MKISVNKTYITLVALVFFSAANFVHAATGIRLFTPATANIDADNNAAPIPGAQFVVIDTAAYSQMRSQQTVVMQQVPLPGGANVSLNLQSFSVFTPGAKFIAETANGPVALPNPTVTLFRGSVVGDATSSAYIAISNNSASGFIKTGGHEYWVGPAYAQNTSGGLCRIYDAASVPPGVLQMSCENPNPDAQVGDALKSEAESQIKSIHSAPKNVASSAYYLVQVAVDVDYEGYTNKWNSDATACQNYITTMFGAISAVYENEANTAVEVNYFHVWETSNEPYTAQTSGGEGGLEPALEQAATWWQSNMDTVSRAAMMLITGKPMCGSSSDEAACGLGFVDYNINGTWYLGVLCNSHYAYSVTAVSGNSSLPELDEEVAAHELGHNFGLLHTQNCFWTDSGFTPTPIDECVPAETDPITNNGSCYTGTVQSQGTIMSYCNNRDFSFGTVVGTWLTNHVVQNAGSQWDCVQPEALEASANTIDFGTQSVDSLSDTTLTDFLTNYSSQAVSVKSCTISGVNKNCFAIKPPTAFSVPANGAHSFSLTFKPDSNGDRYATLTITNTSVNSPITLSLHGYGGAAALTTFQDTLFWDSIPAGTQNLQELDVTNSSNITVNATSSQILNSKGIPDTSVFQVTRGGAPFTLPPGEEPQVVFINYSPSGAESDTATLSIASNAGTLNVPLIGLAVVTSVPENLQIANNFTLSQNYPNPVGANASGMMTTLSYTLARSANISLGVYDYLGRCVAQIVNGYVVVGNHSLLFDAGNLAAGTYIVRLQSGGKSAMSIMTVLK